MARPSKETIQKRNKILELGIFTRGNKLYTEFENILCHDTSNMYIQYSFCEFCFLRSISKFKLLNEFYKILSSEKQYPKIAKNSKNLYDIDKKVNNYYLYLNLYKLFNFKQNAKLEWKTETLIDYYTVEKALGNTRAKKLFEYTDMNLEAMINHSFSLYEKLTSEEKKKIIDELNKDETKDYKTLISRNVAPFSISDYMNSNKSKAVYAELDLTKPLEEIIDYVTMLKNDFDEDPSKFKNAYELLGETHEPFTCDLKKCDIYKDTKSPKPISGRLADVLFIYDCKKVNELVGADIFTNSYIEDEISKYWRNTRNITTEEFTSLSEYYKIAKEYIDNGKYRDYLTGVKFQDD